MKRSLISIILASVLVLSLFVSCTSEQSQTDEGNEENNEQELGVLDLDIAGVGIENFVIVYAESPFSVRDAKNFTTEYNFFKLIAKDIADKIELRTGVTLEVKQDKNLDPTDYEILVGPTNRDQSDPIDELDVFKTYVKVDDGKLVVGAGYNSTSYTGNQKTSYCFASTYHAFDDVDAWMEETLASGVKSADMAEGTDHSGKVDLITVACIGDSITEGFLSSDWNLHSYPAVLQRILWKDHLIINLGNSGRTMRDDLGNRYRGTVQHSTISKFGKLYDYALIMLGTNDSYFDRVWPASSDNLYLESADKLVNDITKRNDKVKVVVMNCPVYYGSEGSGSPHVRALQNLLPERLTNAGVDATFFDMHGFTSKKVGRTNFPDLLHPNDAGYAIMASGVSEMILALDEGRYTYTLPTIKGDTAKGDPERPAIAEGSVNLLSGGDLSPKYPITTGGYSAWYMAGTPYLYMNFDAFSGATVTNIEMPVSSVKKGDKFTVSVVKYSHPSVTETLAKYTLTATKDAGGGWIGFDGLSIEVPEGYTLAFGAPSDTLKVVYLPTHIQGYEFYGSGNNSVNSTAAILFNVYGTKR